MSAEQQAVVYRFLLVFFLGLTPSLTQWLQSDSVDYRLLLAAAVLAAAGAAEKVWANSLGPLVK